MSVRPGQPFGGQANTVLALVRTGGCCCAPLKGLAHLGNVRSIADMLKVGFQLFVLFVLLFPFGQLFPVLHWLFVTYPGASGPMRRLAKRRIDAHRSEMADDSTAEQLSASAGAEKTLKELQSEKANAMVSTCACMQPRDCMGLAP